MLMCIDDALFTFVAPNIHRCRRHTSALRSAVIPSLTVPPTFLLPTRNGRQCANAFLAKHEAQHPALYDFVEGQQRLAATRVSNMGKRARP